MHLDVAIRTGEYFPATFLARHPPISHARQDAVSGDRQASVKYPMRTWHFPCTITSTVHSRWPTCFTCVSHVPASRNLQLCQVPYACEWVTNVGGCRTTLYFICIARQNGYIRCLSIFLLLSCFSSLTFGFLFFFFGSFRKRVLVYSWARCSW